MKTNTGLVEYMEKALAEGWEYVWGTYGKVLTKELFEQKLRQYPSRVGKYEKLIRDNYIGKHTADCVGSIKGYLWLDESTGKINYDPSTDMNANNMFQKAKVKGSIGTIPEIKGLGVYRMTGHIGVYIGNGWVIEARGTKEGFIKSSLKGNDSANWTHWCELPYIEYIKNDKELTLNQAIDYLHKNGHIDSPDYWKQNAVKGKSVPGDIAAFVIIKWAKSLRG